MDEDELPEKKYFFSNLNDLSVSDSEYQHVINVWNKFKIKSLGEHCDLYLKTNVLAFAEVFKQFRSSSLSNLEHVHYFTTLGLSWDAILLHTKILLEIISDNDGLKILVIEVKKITEITCCFV